jgi:nucleoside-diphosphate-sugar epimerase
MPHLLCLGLGYSARAAARHLKADGWGITGTARTPEGAAEIGAAGYDGIVFDGGAPSPAVAAALSTATHLLISVPPGSSGDPVLAHHSADLVAASLEAIAYLSTIGVYGDTGGTWVDEASPANPGSARSRARLEAENAWLALGASAGKRTAILRLAGIYGPGRSAIDNLKAGTARRIVKPGQIFNRIHVEDVAAASIAALLQPGAQGIYNVTDDEPSPPQDVIAYAAGLIGIDPPPETPFADARLSPMAASFYAETKRVRNDRLKRELGLVLSYPTFRQGLAQILTES